MQGFRISGWQEMVLLGIILTFQQESSELKVMLLQSMLQQVYHNLSLDQMLRSKFIIQYLSLSKHL